jgi:hypothetical protein
VAAGDVDGARQGALLVLVGLAHVEHERTLIDALSGAGGIDFGDLGLGGAEQVAERGHGSPRVSSCLLVQASLKA